MDNKIIVRGAKEHNLKNIDLEVPKNKLVVFTGVSGSGKTSLAMDTIFAEGQRRYFESLSSYARQFLGVLKKPDVEKIDGLSPAVAIDQKGISHNPRSTVGTITEIYDYMRLLFARVGHPHCPNCGREIAQQTSQQIVDQIVELAKLNARGQRILILAPLVKDRRGEYSSLFENLKKQGFRQVRVDGKIHLLDEDLVLIKTNKHSIDAVVDKLVVGQKTSPTRLAESIERGLKLGNGLVTIAEILDKGFELPETPQKLEDHLYSERFACPECNISLPDIEPRFFSFNSPHGACSDCQGLGTQLKIDPKLVLNTMLTVNEGGILPWSKIMERAGWFANVLSKVGVEEKLDLNTPIEELSKDQVHTLLYGTGKNVYRVSGRDKYGKPTLFSARYEGVIPNLERRYRQTESEYVRNEVEKYMVKEPCPTCKGARLKKESLSVTILQKNIAEVSALSIKNAMTWIEDFKKSGLTQRELAISKPIVSEITSRLTFLHDVGLTYLTIDRAAATLSSGESQRIRLASQIGSGLSGVLYVLDEPSIGLHYRDQDRLIGTLKKLRDLGNSVLVVEHDQETIEAADWVMDFGPGAGDKGGQLVAEGLVKDIIANKNSLTGQYLSGKKEIILKSSSLNIADKYLEIFGCGEHNLKNIDVKIPLSKLVCVTGVSGSGKSTLVNETLYKALRTQFGMKVDEMPGVYKNLTGSENIDKVINIDQSPIGRTPRSNPATYTKTFDHIRDLFAQTKDAKIRGYTPGRFSFNVRGGRCEACEGEGQLEIKMQFLPDVYIDCEVCGGTRYNRETLEVLYKHKNIAEVLNMTVEEAMVFFEPIPSIHHILETLYKVGLGYIRLGQPAPTLSGGESQRVKLARELAKRQTGRTLYLLDEPTTGLHFADLERLLWCLRFLVDAGNTVLIIEHNLDVIRNADYLIDLGPEGGDAGGSIVAVGTVEQVMENKDSKTGWALNEHQKARQKLK